MSFEQFISNVPLPKKKIKGKIKTYYNLHFQMNSEQVEFDDIFYQKRAAQHRVQGRVK
jgi:hypothetical protein